MAKDETAFWIIFSLGTLSAFCGAILGVMLYPTFKQAFGGYAKYISWGIGIGMTVTVFVLGRYFAMRLLKSK